MKPILLIAASGLAREVLSSIRQTGRHEVTGFLDDDASLHGTTIAGIPVLGAPELARERGEDLLLCAGAGRVREQIAGRLGAAGVTEDRFAVHVDRTAAIGERVTLGPGTVILAGCVLTCDISIGTHGVLMPRVVLTHDDAAGDFVTLTAGVAVGGRVTIGRGAYLGQNASVRQDVRIGAESTLGMGAVLVADLPPGQTWVGNPARPLHSPTMRKVAAL